MANKKTTKKSSKASAGKRVKLEELNQTTGKSYEEQVSRARELEDIRMIREYLKKCLKI
jgi:hypothetical protein